MPSHHLVAVIVSGLVALGAAACGGPTAGAERAADPPRVAAAPPDKTSPAPAEAAASPRASTTPRIIFLGDSLTAGLGLDVRKSFPGLIEERLKREGYHYEVVNAGVSGDTSAGGLRRLQWALDEGRPRILIVALGGNDGLRGLPPDDLERNLSGIVEEGQRRGLTVIVAGMEAPPNNGPDYTSAFRETYRRVAAKYHVKLIPFLLEGVAGDPALNQPDGIHPNERGAQLIADLVWRSLEGSLAHQSTAVR